VLSQIKPQAPVASNPNQAAERPAELAPGSTWGWDSMGSPARQRRAILPLTASQQGPTIS
jgi:hypothetical protein